MFSQSNTDVLHSISDSYHSHEKAINNAKLIRENGFPVGVPDDWLDMLDPPQAMAVAELIQDGILGVCLFDEQGSGKTAMSIAAFDILKRNSSIDAMIVVCPKSMAYEWPKDIEKFTNDKYDVVIADGDMNNRHNASLTKFDVLIVGYEALSSIMQVLISKASTRKYLLVADESFFIKNEDAVRSQNIMKLRYACNRCYVLCGTPAPNSPYDLINQVNLADTGYAFSGFKKTNDVVHDSDKISRILEDKSFYIRRLKTEILDEVPDKKFHVYSVPMTGRQRSMYEQARENLELELVNLGNQKFKRNIATYLQKRATLLQICSCPESIDPTYSEIPGKYIELDKILTTLFETKRKVIIWSFFTKSIDALIGRYAPYHPLRIDGSVSSVDRRTAVNSFQNDPSKLLLIANPAAAGAGITLHASYDAIYFSYSNKAADYLQSLDRIHRRGQVSDHVNYYLLVCDGTIEENEIKRLRSKEVSQSQILGDYMPWPTSFDEALAELQGHA